MRRRILLYVIGCPIFLILFIVEIFMITNNEHIFLSYNNFLYYMKYKKNN